MAFLFKPLRCPHCSGPMDKRLLRQQGLLNDFLNRRAFACPHCQQQIKLPEQAEKVLSVGLFTVVILAPLFYFWPIPPIDPKHVFFLGTAITVVGAWQQKLVKG